jgi:hypothetical protein
MSPGLILAITQETRNEEEFGIPEKWWENLEYDVRVLQEERSCPELIKVQEFFPKKIRW